MEQAAAALKAGQEGRTATFEAQFQSLHGSTIWLETTISPVGGADDKITWLLAVTRDITRAKDTQAELVRSEERYRLASRATNDAFWEYDVLSDTIHWGQAASALFGFGSIDLRVSGQWWEERIHPEDVKAAVKSIAEAMEDGSSGWAFEYRFRRADDSYASLLDRCYFVRDEDGAVVRIVGAMLDLSTLKAAQAKAKTLAERLQTVLESTTDGVCMVDSEWKVSYANAHAETDLASGEKLVGRQIFSAIPGLNDHSIGESLKDAVTSDRPTRVRAFFDPLDAWLEASAFPSSEGLTIFFRDVTEEQWAEDALKLSEERLRLALQAGRIVAWETDLQTGMTTRSENSVAVLGIGSGPASDFWDRVHPEDRESARAKLNGPYDGVQNVELRFIRHDGETLWIRESATRVSQEGSERIVGTLVDITERKVAEERVWHAAHHDALTGLPNRTLFQDRLDQALGKAAATKSRLALMLVDIDNFKDVNDTLGHDAGDGLLRCVAHRLSLGPCDTVARWGGDEFVLLMLGLSTPEAAIEHAQEILSRLSESLTFKGSSIEIRASIGLAIYPDHDGDAAELMKDADLALYEAKAQGRNRVLMYSPAMRDATELRVNVVRDMRNALVESQIVPFYQPKVNLLTGAIVGFEALARWRHPLKGLLTPGAFRSAFGDPELSVAIAETMLKQSAEDLRRWLSAGLQCGTVAVNLSTAEFGLGDLADRILRIIADVGVPFSLFEVEVTETVLLGRSAAHVQSILAQLRANRVSIALDDFGTGYASLSHLKQFPVDSIKIDRSFVNGITEDPSDEAIVAAVIGLAKSLDLTVVAEGVETEEQAHKLGLIGCEIVQGYLYAKPMMATRVPYFLKQHTSLSSRRAGERSLRAASARR
jgi:diguanylate cyclase (GGDEF)-like protein/PAS domain S-box-containing protein